jgi:hypothetical protein
MTTDGGAAPQSLIGALSRKLGSEDFGEPGEYTGEDHAAHAAGKVCVHCDRRIEAGQAARRRGESGWGHDTCPPVLD